MKNDNPYCLANLKSLTTSKGGEGRDGKVDLHEGGDEPSGMTDLRNLTGADTEPPQSSEDDLDSLSTGSSSSFPPIYKPKKNIATKVAVIAGSTLVVITVVSVLVAGAFSKKSDNDLGSQVSELQREIIQLQNKSSAEVIQISERLAKADPPKVVSAVKEIVAQPVESRAKIVETASIPKKADNKNAKAKSEPKEPRVAAKDVENKKSAVEDLLNPPSSRPAKNKSKDEAKQGNTNSLLGGETRKLSRSDVLNGMGKVAYRVKNCAIGKTGTMTLKVIIGTDGHVKSASAAGSFAGTDEGTCAEGVVRSAKFPKSAETTSISYPFIL